MSRFRLPLDATSHSVVRLDRAQAWTPAPTPYPETVEPEYAPPAESAGLLEYWRMIRRRKGTVLLIALTGIALGILVTVPQTPVYQAKTSLEVLGVNENFLNMRDVNPNTTSVAYTPEFDLQTHVKILQSQSLIERATANVDLEKRPLLERRGRLASWRQALGLPTPAPVSVRDQVINAAPENLKVRALPNTRLIEVRYESHDPQFAADFANTLAKQFIIQNLEARAQANTYTGDWLSAQMLDLKVKLEKSEEELQNYARASGLLFTGEKENVADEKLKQLQQELLRARTDRVAKQSKYELARSASADALPEVLDDRTLQEYQSKLTDLRRQVAELSATLTAANPKVIKVQAQVDELKAALDKERANVVQRIQNEYLAAQRREDLLAADYNAHYRLMTDQAAKVSHYNTLKREVDTTRQLHDSMLQRVKEARLASALQSSNIRVIDPAKKPRWPYKPSLVLNSLLGLIAGIGAGVGAAVVRERADRTLQEPGDSVSLLNLEELGVIPSIEGRRPSKQHGIADIRLYGLLAAGSQDSEGNGHSRSIVVSRAGSQAFADSFRTTLTSILFSGNNGSRPRVLVLSSANPGEGKTTIISNLAVALAHINLRVLLIDGDIRKPRLHKIFDEDITPGLTDVLAQPPGSSPAGNIRQTKTPNLFLLPSGRGGEPTLLYSPRLPELIRMLRDEFDMVLIDTPPMLQMSDARVLGRYSDAVILVVRAEQTTRDAALLACERLTQDGTPILGTILNDWNPKHTNAYGYSKYYDRYHRYYHDKTAAS